MNKMYNFLCTNFHQPKTIWKDNLFILWTSFWSDFVTHFAIIVFFSLILSSSLYH